MHTHHVLPGVLVALGHGDLPFQDDDEVVVQVALPVQHLADSGHPTLAAVDKMAMHPALTEIRKRAVQIRRLLERMPRRAARQS